MRKYQSRLAEVEEKKSIKSAAIFGGLTVLIIILAIFFGIPLFSRFVGLISKNTSSTNSLSSATKTLLPPVINPLPQFTNQQSLVVKGNASPNSTVKIFFANASDETTTDGSGNFAMNVGLTKGVNTIYAQTLDSSGNTSINSNSYIINFTTQVPNLTVSTPQNNQTFYGSAQQNLTIQGSTDPANTVTINDHIAVLDNSDKFSYPFNLQNGDNNLKIISTDQAGNKKEIDLKAIFNP